MKLSYRNLKMISCQGVITVSQYDTKVKSLFGEIQKIDTESGISEALIHQIIIRVMDPKYSGLVTSI